LRAIQPEIRRRGAELVVVGSGIPDQAAAFLKEAGVDFPLFVDPELRAYAAAGLRRGVSTVLRPSVFRRAFRAWRAGFRQRGVAGDPWQQGGVFVIRPGGDVTFAHVSRAAGDHADPGAVLQALDRRG
jgi:peroxiredoxin